MVSIFRLSCAVRHIVINMTWACSQVRDTSLALGVVIKKSQRPSKHPKRQNTQKSDASTSKGEDEDKEADGKVMI